MTRYVRTKIAEPFPVCHRPGQTDTAGPFYSAGSEWFVLFTPANLDWKQRSAEALRADGFTVVVDVIERQ